MLTYRGPACLETSYDGFVEADVIIEVLTELKPKRWLGKIFLDINPETRVTILSGIHLLGLPEGLCKIAFKEVVAAPAKKAILFFGVDAPPFSIENGDIVHDHSLLDEARGHFGQIALKRGTPSED